MAGFAWWGNRAALARGWPGDFLSRTDFEAYGRAHRSLQDILFRRTRTTVQVRARAPISSTDLFTYDVTKDGKHFLVNQYLKPDHIVPLTIVEHSLADSPK